MERFGRLVTSGAICVSLPASAAVADPANGVYHDHHGMMGWGGWVYGPVMMLLFFALLVGAVMVVVRLFGTDTGRSGAPQEDRAHAILRERFARGDITQEEFEASRKVLDGDAT